MKTIICFLLMQLALFAQIPDKFTNLKILPKDISKNDLLETMRNFTGALGVKCLFCHEGEEGKPLNFASDLKENKNKAREMIMLVSDVNQNLKNRMGKFTNNVWEVKCITCHRGNKEPLMLSDVLSKTYDKSGIGETLNKYRELRKEFYGGFTYDFRERVLDNFARDLSNKNKPDDALAVLRLNEEYGASSPEHLGIIGDVFVSKGLKDSAKVYYGKALTLQPDNNYIKKKLDTLK